MKILITGGAGFIGSALAKFYFKQGHDIVILDNLISGNLENIKEIINKKNITFFNLDCVNCEKISEYILDCDMVFHFSANPDIRKSQIDSDIDFNNNIIATYELLKCISKSKKLKTFVFASSSVVYGEPAIIPTTEIYGPLTPISFYGASKLACEALISSFAVNNDFNFVIFRFANVVGPESNHGIIYDFIQKLRTDPKKLEILGNGTQKKSYIHIADCIHGIAKAVDLTENNQIFNMGTREKTQVKDIANMVISAMNLNGVQLIFNDKLENGRGWPGDVKIMQLDCSKLESLGWVSKYTSNEAVQQTIKEMLE